jgi:hypothetical protein
MMETTQDKLAKASRECFMELHMRTHAVLPGRTCESCHKQLRILWGFLL